MNIRAMIETLQRFEKINPDMNVAICIEVSKKGVLGNNNFVFHNVEDTNLILIAPTWYEKAQALLEDWREQ